MHAELQAKLYKRAADQLIADVTGKVNRDMLDAARAQARIWKLWALYFMLPTGMMLGAFVHLVLAKVGVS